jgi:uncharacterized protein with HEPN domain
VTDEEAVLVSLAEMLFNAQRARAYAERGGSRWYDDELVFDAVCNRVRELTEVAKYRFPPAARARFASLPWAQMARTREIFTHHYRKVDPDQVREIVDRDLPTLVVALEALNLPDLEEGGR